MLSIDDFFLQVQLCSPVRGYFQMFEVPEGLCLDLRILSALLGVQPLCPRGSNNIFTALGQHFDLLVGPL